MKKLVVKLVPGLLAIVMMLVATEFSVRAQCYSPVTSWTGDYTLTGNASGAPDPFAQYTWTVDHKATGTPYLPYGGADCSGGEWTAGLAVDGLGSTVIGGEETAALAISSGVPKRPIGTLFTMLANICRPAGPDCASRS
jgi:hypothetical protein